MPCSDGGPSDSEWAEMRRDRLKEMKERLDNATQLLCSLLHHVDDALTEEQRAKVFEIKGMSIWWTRHLKEDSLREKRERQAARRLKVAARNDLAQLLEKQKEIEESINMHRLNGVLLKGEEKPKKAIALKRKVGRPKKISKVA